MDSELVPKALLDDVHISLKMKKTPELEVALLTPEIEVKKVCEKELDIIEVSILGIEKCPNVSEMAISIRLEVQNKKNNG